jgi:two-component system alkaline phosphatase synthesis response regulator PhoP
MNKILVVEDEKTLLEALVINLSREGYEIVQADRGDTGLELALKAGPDLVLLDVMLPGMDGLEVCRELRKRGINVPIIMLTAKTEEIDRTAGLEVGADDYVCKPFSARELLARIRVQLRRWPTQRNNGLTRYSFDDIEIDFKKFRATREGEPLELTLKQFEILKLLIECQGEVVTRDRILDEIWGREVYVTTRTIDNHVLKLRKETEENPSNPQHILSIYGQGYKFVD